MPSLRLTNLPNFMLILCDFEPLAKYMRQRYILLIPYEGGIPAPFLNPILFTIKMHCPLTINSNLYPYLKPPNSLTQPGHPH